MTVLRVIEIIVAIGALIGAIATVWHKAGFAKMKKRTSTFLDDWFGEDPRDGYEGRQSFPLRMAKVEERTAALNHDMRDEFGGRLALIEQQLNAVITVTDQLKRNGGSTIADAVHRIGAEVTTLRDQADRLEGYATDNREGIGRLDERVTGIEGRYEADARTSRDLEQYLATERKDLVVRAAALEASVNELLMVEGREQRELRPDELPDL